ncbi:hypothetical protein [Actinopolymorpha pittospori]
MSEQAAHLTPARLSPLRIESRPCPLPYGLTWEDLQPCLPGFASAVDAQAWTSHVKQGLHRGSNSRILTLRHSCIDGSRRTQTFFFKEGPHFPQSVDAPASESAKYRFLTSTDVPTPRLLHVVERADREVMVLEFLPTIGIQPDEADELLLLIAHLNAVRQPPLELFRPGPGLPRTEFDALVKDALTTLTCDPTAQVTVEPRRWFTAYRRAEEAVSSLPSALNHGELYFQQVGWSGAGGEHRLVLFDLETMALLPRFTDIAAILRPLAVQTGCDERELFSRYLDALRQLTGYVLDENQAWTEMLSVRVVAAFQSLPWLTRTAGHPDIHDTPAGLAHVLLDDLRALDLLR